MRVNGDSVVLLDGVTKTADEYVAYIKVLSVKPYLTTKEAATFFDIGINRMRALYARPDLADQRIRKGTYDLLPRDVVRDALVEESEVAANGNA